MPNFGNMSLSELIRPEGFECACGKKHVCALKYLNIGRGIVGEVPAMVAAMGKQKPFVVCDENTWAVAGRRVDEVLTRAGVAHAVYVIPLNNPDAGRIAPGEWEAGSILMHFDPSCDMLLAVGSGVVNDLCRVVANATGRPSAVVGTAPSMDGYASNCSSMEVNHVKVSIYGHVPQGILLDSEILAQAPMRMLWAGLGDMVAKYVAVCEWQISHLVTGEYYCEDVAELMRSALRKLMAAADRIPARDPDAVASIADGLVRAGIGMAFAGVSRPASGLEHYFSHMWEMMALERGVPYDLHGIQVGVGTLLTLQIYQRLLADTAAPDRAKAEAHMRAFDRSAWEARVRRVFGKTAGQILEIEEKTRKNDPDKHARRLSNIVAHWDEIAAIARRELPDFEQLRAVMAQTGMPLTPADIGIPTRDVVDAFVCARDIRDKYLTCSLLWDLGLTDEYARFLESFN